MNGVVLDETAEIELTDYYNNFNSFIELVGLKEEDSNVYTSDCMRAFFFDSSMDEFTISNTGDGVSAYGIKIGDSKDGALASAANYGAIIPITNSNYENELSIYLWDEIGDYSVVVVDLVFNSQGLVESWSVCNWPEGDWMSVILDAMRIAHQINLTEFEDWQISYLQMLIEYGYDYYEGYLLYVDNTDISDLILLGDADLQTLTIHYSPDGNSVTNTDSSSNCL